MRRAEEEDEGDAAAEINDLAADAEVPIEELMRRYREMEAAHGGGDEEQNGDEEEEDGDGMSAGARRFPTTRTSLASTRLLTTRPR